MGAGEFAKSHSDGSSNQGGSQKADDGGAGAEQKPGADGAADSDHGHLPGAELLAEPFFIGGDVGQSTHQQTATRWSRRSLEGFRLPLLGFPMASSESRDPDFLRQPLFRQLNLDIRSTQLTSSLPSDGFTSIAPTPRGM